MDGDAVGTAAMAIAQHYKDRGEEIERKAAYEASDMARLGLLAAAQDRRLIANAFARFATELAKQLPKPQDPANAP